ncbi:MAG: flippase [Ignavibacteriales bacterium]|nr:flippase [Ignavibacteriales bacterium]
MPPKQTIRQNITWLVAVNLISKPLWFLFLLISARILGPSEFGKYMLSIAYMSVLIGILEGGIDIHMIRTVASNPNRFHSFFSYTLWIKIGSGIVAGMIAFCIGLAVPSLVPSWILFIAASIYTIANTLLTHLRFVFRAFEVMKYEAWSIVIEKISVTILCSAPLIFFPFADEYGILFSLAYVITCIVTMRMIFTKIGNPGLPTNWRTVIPEIIKPALPFAAINIFIIVYLRSGTILLTIMTQSDLLVGYFNAGYRLVEAFVLFPSTIIAPLYPVLARRINDREEVSRLASDAIRIILSIAVIVSVPIILLHEEVTLLLFGEEYRDAALSVGILSFAMIPIGINWVMGTLVAVTGRQTKANYYIFFITVGNILLLILLIPLLGVEGAAIAVLLTEFAIVSANLLLVRDIINIPQLVKSFGKVVALSIVSFIIPFTFPFLHFALKIFSIVVTLTGGFYVFRMITPNDLTLVFREKVL